MHSPVCGRWAASGQQVCVVILKNGRWATCNKIRHDWAHMRSFWAPLAVDVQRCGLWWVAVRSVSMQDTLSAALRRWRAGGPGILSRHYPSMPVSNASVITTALLRTGPLVTNRGLSTELELAITVKRCCEAKEEDDALTVHLCFIAGWLTHALLMPGYV